MSLENKKVELTFVNEVICGNCLDVMKGWPDNSIDAIVTDPPYGISFQSKKWDYDVPSVEIWQEALRVLKPGGHALIACGTRTQHRMVVNVEDAGFEVRDIIVYCYGSGFPKSLNISVALDREIKKQWEQLVDKLQHFNSKEVLSYWKQTLNNAKHVEQKFQKLETVAGINTNKKDSAQEDATVYSKVEKFYVNAIIAELNSIGLPHIKELCVSIVPESVGQNTTQLQDSVKYVVKPSLNQNQLQPTTDTFTVELSAKVMQKENLMDRDKGEEVLKTWLGKKMSSLDTDIVVLCAEQIETLKLTILNQSKTFLNLDTQRQMDCVCATNVIITESTMECLITNTVNTLKQIAIDKELGYADGSGKVFNITAPSSDLAKQYDGYGTGLKPAIELWTLARKPISERNIALNVIRWGTGGINIDKCRVGTTKDVPASPSTKSQWFGNNNENGTESGHNPNIGRFPSNLILDGTQEVLDLFPVTKSGGGNKHPANSKIYGRNSYNESATHGDNRVYEADEGTASRFFYNTMTPNDKSRDNCIQFSENKHQFNYGEEDNTSASRFFYCSKSSPSEKSKGLPEGMKNIHPTCKPVRLMEYLCRLSCPTGGTILDPFCGSGSTLVAAKNEGFNYIGIDLSEEYCNIARHRINEN